MKNLNPNKLSGGYGSPSKRGAFTFLEKMPLAANRPLPSPGSRLVNVNGVNDILKRQTR